MTNQANALENLKPNAISVRADSAHEKQAIG
jgi:hypothetical protein